MAPKKDLAALAAREALAKKATEKRKRSAHTAEERELRRIWRGRATLRAPPPPLVERVEEVYPDLPVIITPSFLHRSAGEGSSLRLMIAWDRISRALILDGMRAYEQADDKGLIGWHYVFIDFCK